MGAGFSSLMYIVKFTILSLLLSSMVLVASLLFYHWNADILSSLLDRRIVLPFTNLEDMYRNTPIRIALVPGTSWEYDFKAFQNPTWQNIYAERIYPYLEEYSAYSTNAGWKDMNYYLTDNYDTAVYSAKYVMR